MDESDPGTTAQDSTETMEVEFAAFRDQQAKLHEILSLLHTQNQTSHEEIACLKDSMFCFDLALTFYMESNRALQAEAWFAAAAIAASALESFLLGRCFLQRDEIKALPKWQTLKKTHKKNFRLFANSLDLGKLLEIAGELSWFQVGGIPAALSAVMSRHLDEPSMTAITGYFQGAADVGKVCATHVREYRNLLHPAVCLREGRQPTREAGITATFLFLIAFSALMPKT